jgi:hypothetical protein
MELKMKITYFSNCENIDAVKKLFKELIKKHHPDLNKNEDSEITKFIILEYNYIKDYFALNDKLPFSVTTETKANFDLFNNLDNETKIIVNKLQQLENITIEIIGSWVWVSGNTFLVKDYLKELNCKFSGSKKMWFYTKDDRKQKASNLDINEIKLKYGFSEVKNNYNYKLA